VEVVECFEAVTVHDAINMNASAVVMPPMRKEVEVSCNSKRGDTTDGDKVVADVCVTDVCELSV
jgi:hypothetical protein